jgi:hypothetical protein
MGSLFLISIVFFFLFNCTSSVTEEKDNKNQKSVVTIEKEGEKFTLFRNGEPYYVKGIGGNKNFDQAATAGANSIRTWGTDNAGELLDEAHKLGMTVYLNLWLSHNSDDYSNESYLQNKRTELQGLIMQYKDHPALLMWSLGNENYLASGRNNDALKFINELAEMIHEGDPNHPVATILVGTGVSDINAAVQYAPALDMLAVNSYAAVKLIDGWIKDSDYEGAYMVTEWGVNGHWEVGKTSWGWPLEQSSTEKAESYLDRYNHIYANRDRCLGSYVFYWGQKQERTPTWFSMFIEDGVDGTPLNGEACPVIDVMHYCWKGVWPENTAPVITEMTLNGRKASSSVTLSANTVYEAVVSASDADGDSLTFIWEILKESTDLGDFGSAEGRPNRVGDAITTTAGSTMIPGLPTGRYILFVYIFDHHDHAGTANIPFRVD